MKNKRFKSALSLLLVLLLCFSVMAPSFAAQTVDLAATGADKTMEKHANSATISRAEIIGLFGDSTSILNTAFYGFAPLPDSGTELDTSTITYVSGTSAIAAGEYLALKTTANGGSTFNRRPNWNDLSKRSQLTLTFKTYYTASFTVTGSGDGALYLNGNSVSGSVNLYTDETYTVTAADVEGFNREVTGVTLGEAFAPTSDMNITAAYTPNASADIALTVSDGGTAKIVSGGIEVEDTIPAGETFSVETTPNTDKGYALDSIVVTKNGDEIEANNGVYGPAANGDVFAVSVTFVFAPEVVNYEVSATNARLRSSDFNTMFGESGTHSYGYASVNNPDSISSLSLINGAEFAAGEYYIYSTSYSLTNPNWANGTVKKMVLRTYYNGTFTVTGNNEGEVYLNNEKVDGSVRLYTDTEYTVTAKDVAEYNYTITGAVAGTAFTPSANITVTVSYLKTAFATYELNVGDGGTAQVLVYGEPANDRISEGDSFTVTATPNENAGYKLDSIVVTENGTAIEPNEGVYGPAKDQAVYAITVSFTYDPPKADIEVDANEGTVSLSDINGFFNNSYNYYGIAKEADDEVTYLYTLLGNENDFIVTNGDYFIYGSSAGNALNPNWTNAKVMILTVRTYYNVTFSATGCNEGEIHLNGEAVTGSQKLYTDTEYTVTAKAVDDYDVEITGAEDGVAFTPDANTPAAITATYTKNKFATYTLSVGEGGTAQVLVNGEPAGDRISEGDSFTVTATPNENAGYKFDSIVVTENGTAIEPNEGVYGPAKDQAVYAITVSFTYDPPRTEIEVDANKGTVSRSDISGLFEGSYSYYGIAKEKTDDVTYLYNLLGYENPFNVTDGEYFIYGSNAGSATNPNWDNAKLMILNVKTYYTVTWKNWDGSVLKTDSVAPDATPSYDGETPERPEDANATYTFSAWDDGTTTYLIGVDDLPPITGDITYTAVYTADIKDLFVAHSITLGGDIGVNFYIDSNVAGVADAQTAVVKFAWDGGNYIKEVNLKELIPDEKGWLKATVNVVAAQMAHTIEATAFINGNMFYTVDLYSVQDYAKAVYDEPEKYDDKGKPEQLKALAAAMLHYGSEAQTVFADALTVKPDRADSVIANDPADYTGVTADAVAAKINGEASDLNDVARQLGAKYYTNSLIYLSKNTLRVYFTPNEYGQAMPNADAYAGSQSNNYYYYAEKTNIPATQLDNQQEFTVGDVNFYFSPLDYVKAVLSSSKMTDAQKNLAASLFLYNQAANAYFD